MRLVRVLALVLLFLVMYGTLAGSAAYAWYLRSAAYRQYCAKYLSQRLELPADIGRIQPRSFATREFDNVVVWLPDRRGRALSCDQAIVANRPRPDDPEAYEIELIGGSTEISTRTWLRSDYRGVIESGLRPGFAPDGPQRVTFADMDLAFERERFNMLLSNANGVVRFEPDFGQAVVTCRELNGCTVGEAVILYAAFSPRALGIRIDEVELKVPRLPLVILGLDQLVDSHIRSGSFHGRLQYGESDAGTWLRASGQCFDVKLSECTAGLLPRPWRGRCDDLELRELFFREQTPERLRFAGVLRGLVLGDILTPWGLADIGGEVTLSVREADLSPRGIHLLIASGSCTDVSLEHLTAGLGWGRMTGNLRVSITDLTIEDNRLRSLEAEVRVEDAGAEPNWIEGELLRNLITRVLKFDLPAFLPESIWREQLDYSRLGFRLDVEDEVLHVFGTHGSREKTILTIRVLGRDLPIVREPERAIPLDGWMDQLRERAADILVRQFGDAALIASPDSAPVPE